MSQATRPGPLPDRVTMPLLELVTREAVDSDYARVAARRRAARPGGGAPGGRRTALRGAAVVTAVFGLLIALAAVQTSRDADVQDASRQALVDRIKERRAEVSDLEAQVDPLRRQISDLQDTSGSLRGQLATSTVLLRQLQISTGFVAVTGPGVRITVDDNPDGDADGQVRATDLRLLVNGLWQAGAEAVAVNGRRLTVLSALSNSSIAVNVNRQPLTPPYVVTAIGDPRTLQADLLDTTTGVQFQSLAEQFGFVVDRQNEEQQVQIPAASDAQLRLRWAEQDTAPARPDQQQEVTP